MTLLAGVDTCKPCFIKYRRSIPLQINEYDVACPECGTIDANATASHSHVSVAVNSGAVLDEEAVANTYEGSWDDPSSAAERAFRSDVDVMITFHLRMWAHEHHTGLRNTARNRLRQITLADLKPPFRRKPTTNRDARRLPYLVAVAVKMALQENGIAVLDCKLQREKQNQGGPSVVASDEAVQMPSLSEMFVSTWPVASTPWSADSQEKCSGAAAARNRAGIATLASLSYLSLLHDRYSKLFGNAVSAGDAVLCLMRRFIDKMRRFSRMNKMELDAYTKTDPTQGAKSDDRRWEISDWEFFRRIRDWDEVLKVAQGIYDAQECVGLFGPRSRIPVAAAITLASVEAINGEVTPQTSNILRELCAQFGQTAYNASSVRAVLRRFFVAWSTSIDDAGVPFPLIEMTGKGNIGDGTMGYGSDKRRGIPEPFIAAKATRTVAENWERIAEARLRRDAVMPFDKELELARVIFAKHAVRPGAVRPIPSLEHVIVRKPSLEPEKNPAATPESLPATPHPNDLSLAIEMEPPATMVVDHRQSIPNSHATDIERLLAAPDDSSDEGDADGRSECSGDENWVNFDQTQHPRLGSFLLGNKNHVTSPVARSRFEFTIGPGTLSFGTPSSRSRRQPEATSPDVSRWRHDVPRIIGPIAPTSHGLGARNQDETRPVAYPPSPSPTPSARTLVPIPSRAATAAPSSPTLSATTSRHARGTATPLTVMSDIPPLYDEVEPQDQAVAEELPDEQDPKRKHVNCLARERDILVGRQVRRATTERLLAAKKAERAARGAGTRKRANVSVDQGQQFQAVQAQPVEPSTLVPPVPVTGKRKPGGPKKIPSESQTKPKKSAKPKEPREPKRLKVVKENRVNHAALHSALEDVGGPE